MVSRDRADDNLAIWNPAFGEAEVFLQSGMNFDIKDLRLFVAAAELGNLSRAAESQHLSLAAASERIKGIEGQAGLSLLKREARGVRLLPQGEAFLHHARLVLRQAEQMQADLQEYAQGRQGHLRVFANTTAATDFLPEILPDFLSLHPRINVDLQEKPNAEIPQGVLEGLADLGIIAGEVETFGLESIRFSTDRLVVVTPLGHPLATRQSVAYEATLDEGTIGLHETSTFQEFLTRISERLGRRQKLRVQLRNFDAVCRMVGRGVGIGVVPESIARRNQKAMKLAIIELTDSWRVRERHVLMRDRSALPVYAQSFLETLIKFFRVA